MSWLDSFSSWVGGLFGNKPKPNRNEDQIAAIQKCAVQTCQFLPLAESVGGILAQSTPGAMTAISVANYICGIVTKSPPVGQMQTLVGTTQQVQTWQTPGGITIQGSFVNK